MRLSCCESPCVREKQGEERKNTERRRERKGERATERGRISLPAPASRAFSSNVSSFIFQYAFAHFKFGWLFCTSPPLVGNPPTKIKIQTQTSQQVCLVCHSHHHLMPPTAPRRNSRRSKRRSPQRLPPAACLSNCPPPRCPPPFPRCSYSPPAWPSALPESPRGDQVSPSSRQPPASSQGHRACSGEHTRKSQNY